MLERGERRIKGRGWDAGKKSREGKRKVERKMRERKRKKVMMEAGKWREGKRKVERKRERGRERKG